MEHNAKLCSCFPLIRPLKREGSLQIIIEEKDFFFFRSQENQKEKGGVWEG